MANADLILSIRGLDDRSATYLTQKHNEARILPDSSEEEEPADDSSEQSTPTREGFPNEGRGPRLGLTFDQAPKDKEQGWIFGSDPTASDILLGEGKGDSGISEQHFSITFDEQRRIIVKDLGAKNGTAVSYTHVEDDNQVVPRGAPIRRNFTWILFHDWNIKLFSFRAYFKFEVLLGPRTQDADFAARVGLYLGLSEDAMPSSTLAQAGSQQTAAPRTNPRSRSQKPIYIPGRYLGKGGFGVVHEVINVSTGEVCAAKEFSKDDRIAQEVDNLKRLRHEHIVRFVDFVKKPSPALLMEYLPLGDLSRQAHLSREELKKLLQQVLRALEYLHAEGIAHRDIKPQNILVRQREPSLHIKLCDFGLAKADRSSLKTLCGTADFIAPEIRDGTQHYDNKVDIWSLGVVMLQYFKDRLERNGVQWNRYHPHSVESAARTLHTEDPQDPLFVLMTCMLRCRVPERLSATECLERAETLGLFDPDSSVSRSGHETPSENSTSAPPPTRARSSSLTLRPRPSASHSRTGSRTATATAVQRLGSLEESPTDQGGPPASGWSAAHNDETRTSRGRKREASPDATPSRPSSRRRTGSSSRDASEHAGLAHLPLPRGRHPQQSAKPSPLV